MAEQDMNSFLEQFHTQGYFILKNIFDPAVLEEAKEGISKIVDSHAERLLQQNKITDLCPDEPFEKRLYRLYQNHLSEAPALFRAELHLEQFYNLFFHQQLLDYVQQILGNEILLYPNYSVRPKLPDFEAARVLWHQDGGYTDSGNNSDQVADLRMVNAWAPLVPANVQNGCMQFIPYTHKLGVVPHVKKQYYLEIASEQLEPRKKDAVDIELNPGDVVLFHNLLFHQGLPNLSDHIRWSLDWRYLDATQPTLRKEKGHLARSGSRPDLTVKSREEWAGLTLS